MQKAPDLMDEGQPDDSDVEVENQLSFPEIEQPQSTSLKVI